MFPPAATVPYLLAYALAAHLGLQGLAGQTPLRLTWRACSAAVSVLLFGLLLRVYDELKDADSDRVLGAAGDPRYRDRPIVTGEVTEEDLRTLRNLVILALFALNLPLGFPFAVPGFLAAFGIVWLSSRWFFWKAISRHLLLALATHNPIPLVFLGYVGAVYTQDFGTTGLGSHDIPLLVGLWLPWTAWETSRKIRVPQDETRYQTYSKILGWRVAALVPALCVVASLALLAPVLQAAGLGVWPIAVLYTSAALIVLACLRFRFWPSPRRAHLRPFVEAYGTAVNLGIVIGLTASHGVRFP
jgi:4-hydroxybenzoate polyprenyltransferase